MKLYLSSYKLGDAPHKLRDLFEQNLRVGYIPNALDSQSNDKKWLQFHIQSDLESLREINLEPELLDLKSYFGKKELLKAKLEELGGLWISGGNVFILRQAMQLSGFDELIKTLYAKADFVYGGYSAGCCVLSQTLDAYAIVDDANDMPYQEIKTAIMSGLGLIDYIFLPHFESTHSESGEINKEVEYCRDHKLPFKTFRDGEVLIR